MAIVDREEKRSYTWFGYNSGETDSGGFYLYFSLFRKRFNASSRGNIHIQHTKPNQIKRPASQRA